jgi:putative CocE/NonD family hydrolase
LSSNGALTPSAAAPETATSFTYDPARRAVVPRPGTTEPANWRDVANSAGVIAFSSEPLAQPVEITGHVLATLWIAADVPDTDVTVRLLAVAPSGVTRALTNAYGALRASYRTTEIVQKPRPLTPGAPAELTISVGYTSVLVPAGDRLQVIVTGSMRQGLETQDRRANVRVLHGGTHASRVVLPIIPR